MRGRSRWPRGLGGLFGEDAADDGDGVADFATEVEAEYPEVADGVLHDVWMAVAEHVCEAVPVSGGF